MRDDNDDDTASNLPARRTDIANALDEASRDRSTYLKFAKGIWVLGSENVDTGRREFTADPQGWAKVWTKWLYGLPVVKKVYSVVRKEEPPERDELGDLDESLWELDDKDKKPKDPWQFSNVMPMQDNETGQECLFTTISAGGAIAIQEVARAFTRRLRRGLTALPIVKLGTDHFDTRAYTRILRPAFPVVGWVGESEGGDPGLIEVNPESKPKPPDKESIVGNALRSRRDLDDEIPSDGDGSLSGRHRLSRRHPL